MSQVASSVGGLIILIIIGVIIYNVAKPSTWTAVYEDPTKLMVQSGGEFKDKDSCLRWVYSARLKDNDNYGYECGKDCKPPETPNGLYVCSETVDQ